MVGHRRIRGEWRGEGKGGEGRGGEKVTFDCDPTANPLCMYNMFVFCCTVFITFDNDDE